MGSNSTGCIGRQNIAVAGKALRRSFDRSFEKKGIHMVSVWVSESGFVLGQIKTATKFNEIAAIPQLLKMLEICWVCCDNRRHGVLKRNSQNDHEPKN